VHQVELSQRKVQQKCFSHYFDPPTENLDIHSSKWKARALVTCPTDLLKCKSSLQNCHGTLFALKLADICLILFRLFKTNNKMGLVILPVRFNSRNKIISIVDNEVLYFVEANRRGGKKAVESVKLADLLNDDADADLIPFSVRHRVNNLLIVPDYWFENFICKFQSIKKSLADAFVERKLQAQFPQLPDVKYFFDSVSYQREHKERWLYAYFLQDPQFFQLYKTLSRLSLAPHRITSPALIWGSKIRQKMPDFNDGGKCFIELLNNLYHLYFYFEGNFLFSRSIPLADLSVDSPDNLQAITYELNQSLYLFSQRAKAEVNKLYLVSSQNLAVDGLSEALDREIEDLSFLFTELSDARTDNTPADPIDGFVLFHFLLKNQFQFVAHKKLKKELEWRPVQAVGMAIAILLCLLLGLESIFLHKWSHQNQVAAINSENLDAGKTKQRIRQYNAALDILIEDAERHSPREVIAKIARSLPLEIRMQEIFLKTETDTALDFKGVAKALGSERLKGSLSVLIANLNQNLHPRKPLVMPDIDIEFDKNKQSYFIKFRVEL
jgi:hypothetical protein